jgi:hypothetical protein
MFEAARRSRACAYLADDDHGPLALQEILLAGCPVIGVRTGAPFIQDGVTGVFVDRLPPGAKCVKSDGDMVDLLHLATAVNFALGIDRHTVRATASWSFSTHQIADTVIDLIFNERIALGN